MNDKTKIIGIFYIIFGALGILGLPIIYIQNQVMNTLLTELGPIDEEIRSIMRFFHDLMDIMIPAMVALIIVHIILNVLVGIFFIKHKAYHICFVTSILTCLLFPLGTVLGIFSLVTLIDKEIKKLFYINKQSG